VLIRIDENSATLTPFGSLIRITPAKSRSAKSWTAKLGKILAWPLPLIGSSPNLVFARALF
jgi:hypothetical protein